MARRRAVPVCAVQTGRQQAAPTLTSRCQDGHGRMPRQRGRAATPRASSVTWCTRLVASPRCTGPRHGDSCTTRRRTTAMRRVRSSQPKSRANDPLARERPLTPRPWHMVVRLSKGNHDIDGRPTFYAFERATERELDTHVDTSRPRCSRSSQPTKRRELVWCRGLDRFSPGQAAQELVRVREQDEKDRRLSGDWTEHIALCRARL